MGKVIVVAMQKGGCSKTSVTLNLGIGLGREEKKVLLIDNDLQGSLTASLGFEEPDEMIILWKISKCVTDITEIKATNGKLYVSAIFDCFDLVVLGLAMDTNMKEDLLRNRRSSTHVKT